MKVGVHEGSALSSLLFIMIMYVLTEDASDGSLMELLCAGNLALCGESLNEVMNKYVKWKNAVEGKGLRMNVNKTKGMQLLFGKKISVLKVYPCGVCGEWLSIEGMKCQRWVHCCCFDVPRQVSLPSCQNVSVCITCLGHNC